MPINWAPLNKFADAYQKMGVSKQAKERQEQLDYLKKLQVLKEVRPYYSDKQMEEMAVGLGDDGPPIPVPQLKKEVDAYEKSYDKKRGSLQAEAEFPGLKKADPDWRGGDLRELEERAGFGPTKVTPTIRGTEDYQTRVDAERAEITAAKGQVTDTQKDIKRRIKALPKVEELTAQDPNRAYSRGWKINDDRSVFKEFDTGAPVKMQHWTKGMGKRGNPKQLALIGGLFRDSKQILDLLEDPEVKESMGGFLEGGFLNQIKGKTVNTIRRMLQERGFSTKPKVMEVIARIHTFASEKRHDLLGAAVTPTEFRSVRGWLAEAGDTYPLLLEKMKLFASEGEERLREWVGMYDREFNFSEVYDAFGLTRFPEREGPPGPPRPAVEPPPAPAKAPQTSGYVEGQTYPGAEGTSAIYRGKNPEGKDLWQIQP